MSDQKHKSERSETKLLGEGRIAFPFFHEKRTKSAGGDLLDKPRYDGVFLLPKLHTDPMQCANYALLAGMCMEAATKAWQQFPQGGKWPIQDGDVPQIGKPKPNVAPLTPEQIAAKNKWRAGHWVIEIASGLDTPPKVVVRSNGVDQEIPAKVIAGIQMYKSGDFGFVSANAYTFHNKTFGVNFGFEGVMFTRPGELIGSGGQRTAQQMFGAVANLQPAGGPPIPGAQAPAAAAPPPQPQQMAPVAAAAPPVPGAAPMPPGMAPAGAPPLPPMPGR